MVDFGELREEGNSANAYYAFSPSGQLLEDTEHQAALQQHGFGYYRIFAAPAAGPRNFSTMGIDPLLAQLGQHHTEQQHHHADALQDRQSSQFHASTSGSSSGSHDAADISAGIRQQQPPSKLDCTGPRWLLGGSLAAVRFCALVSGGDATDKLVRSFTGMYYEPGTTGEHLAEMMEGCFDAAAPCPDTIIHHPHWRLAIMVTALRPWAALLPAGQLKALFYAYLAANAASHRAMDSFQRRICFYTGPDPPPWIDEGEDVTCVPLTSQNLRAVLAATTCLPFVSRKCTHIPGLGAGVYYDGALSDYVLNVRLNDPAYPCLLLSMAPPGQPIKATIWDAYVPWRGLPCSAFRHVSVMSPTLTYVSQLHGGAMPDTWDFFKSDFIAHPEKREAAWHHARALSLRTFPAHPLHAVRVPSYSSPDRGSAAGLLLQPDEGCARDGMEQQGGGKASGFVTAGGCQSLWELFGWSRDSPLSRISSHTLAATEAGSGKGAAAPKAGSSSRSTRLSSQGAGEGHQVHLRPVQDSAADLCGHGCGAASPPASLRAPVQLAPHRSGSHVGLARQGGAMECAPAAAAACKAGDAGDLSQGSSCSSEAGAEGEGEQGEMGRSSGGGWLSWFWGASTAASEAVSQGSLRCSGAKVGAGQHARNGSWGGVAGSHRSSSSFTAGSSDQE